MHPLDEGAKICHRPGIFSCKLRTSEIGTHNNSVDSSASACTPWLYLSFISPEDKEHLEKRFGLLIYIKT